MTRSADGELNIDSVLRNTYKVVSVLGRGGMGSVFLAQHLRLPGKQVAVKVLRIGDHVGPDLHVRFRREAEIASRLGHPNIVEVLDFDTLEDGSPFLVLEYLRGESLADRLRRGRLSLEEVFSFTRQMGSALQTAHRAGVVHRDLKPANIFLVPTDSGGVVGERVKLLDFGISKVMSSETLQTQEAVLIGTPQYMSPEQAQGHNRRIDARTDLFALGGIVFEMLSGMTPFGGGSLAQIIYRVVHEPPVSLSTLMPDLPPNVARAVTRALEKNPDDRHPDVGAFITELTGATLQSLPETEEQLAARTFSRSKRPSGVALPSVAPDDEDAMGATMAPANKGPGTGRFGPGAVAEPDDIGFDATLAPRGSSTTPFGQQAQAAGGTLGFGATQMPASGVAPGAVGASGVALPAQQAYGTSPQAASGSIGGQHVAPGHGTGQHVAPGSLGGQLAPGSIAGQQHVAPGSLASQHVAPGGLGGQQLPPGSIAGQHAAPGSFGGQHAAPASSSGQHIAPGSLGGQQAVPGSLAGPVGPHGQPLAPVSVAGVVGAPGPTTLPVDATSGGKPKSRVLPVAGAAALILGAVGLGWWLRPAPVVAPPIVASTPPQPVAVPPPAVNNVPPPLPPPTTAPQPPPQPPVVAQTPPTPTAKVPSQGKPKGIDAPAAKQGLSVDPPNEASRVALEGARAAIAEKDLSAAINRAQRSYTDGPNLAARLLLTQIRCMQKDLGGARAEWNLLPKKLRQKAEQECRKYEVDLSMEP
ncbi:serine/threonine-protein kinase [Corallococcus silvisoli]|uniref:serine/threonine-protein kinase n=1 Tax=Corallococcus silvisoli TaxID=2697031 RepID=UPI001377D060|nr:serine/threonine-protein kinase [Corallococcus silvisoli]NBD12062.1 protein kinase [Corallococcus silvisoli]